MRKQSLYAASLITMLLAISFASCASMRTFYRQDRPAEYPALGIESIAPEQRSGIYFSFYRIESNRADDEHITSEISIDGAPLPIAFSNYTPQPLIAFGSRVGVQYPLYKNKSNYGPLIEIPSGVHRIILTPAYFIESFRTVRFGKMEPFEFEMDFKPGVYYVFSCFTPTAAKGKDVSEVSIDYSKTGNGEKIAAAIKRITGVNLYRNASNENKSFKTESRDQALALSGYYAHAFDALGRYLGTEKLSPLAKPTDEGGSAESGAAQQPSTTQPGP